MKIHLVNPSHVSFGVAVITPRWLYVIAEATPRPWGDPILTDETLEQFDPAQLEPGDVVGIGIHTANALRGYEIGRVARARRARVIFGGIHATLFPDEAHERGGATAVVRGDGDVVWAQALADCANGVPRRVYEGGWAQANVHCAARWNLLPSGRYMLASVQTVRGCPKHCSFCSVWRTDGQQPRQRAADAILDEIVQLRRLGFRFILLADDNFYPVTLDDLAVAARRNNPDKLRALEATRAARFELMARLAELPDDMVFYTQITMEAANDPPFLEAMRKARIRGALVGIESVTPAGLKDVFKGFNVVGDELVARLQMFRRHGVHVLGSFIFGLPSDLPETFEATTELARRAGLTFAQFVLLTPLPGTVDFERWERNVAGNVPLASQVPLTRYWLLPPAARPKLVMPHPAMSADEIRQRTQQVWDRFYRLRPIWQRSACIRSLRGRLAFVLISKLYRQMYANTGMATDSARKASANRWARWLAKPCLRFFAASPQPARPLPAPRATCLGVMLSLAVAAGGAAQEPPQPVPPRPAVAQLSVTPDSTLPVVRAHQYRMAGKVRPFLFWIGQEEVGHGRIIWRKGDSGAVAYELLIGSDPAVAPRGLNRWGYIAEEVRGSDGELLGVMSRSDERSMGEVREGLNRGTRGHSFVAIRSSVVAGTSHARVWTIRSAEDLTVRNVRTVLELLEQEPRDVAVQTAPVARGVRTGFLAAVAELIRTSVGMHAGSPVATAASRRTSVPYVYGGAIHDLTLRSHELLQERSIAGRTYTHVVHGKFEIHGRVSGDKSRFEVIYGTRGHLSEVPIFIAYQPRWWLRVELLQDADGPRTRAAVRRPAASRVRVSASRTH